MVGDVGVGGRQPIRVQSMTTPATTDTAATVEQIERLVDAGCEIVRLTVPRRADADNLPAIRAELSRRRVHVPLVADIHFTPAAAMQAVLATPRGGSVDRPMSEAVHKMFRRGVVAQRV